MAKPTAFVLNRWLGKEAINFYQENDLKELVKFHMNNPKTEIQNLEGTGVINFLNLDDLKIAEEGEIIEPKSIIEIEFKEGEPVFPPINRDINNAFLNKIYEAKEKWIILIDKNQKNIMALNSDQFILGALFENESFNPLNYCHKPIIVRNNNYSLNDIISQFKVNVEHQGDDVIDNDIILLWNKKKENNYGF